MKKKLMPLQTGGGVRAPDTAVSEIPQANDPYASYKVRFPRLGDIILRLPMRGSDKDRVLSSYSALSVCYCRALLQLEFLKWFNCI